MADNIAVSPGKKSFNLTKFSLILILVQYEIADELIQNNVLNVVRMKSCTI